MKGWRHQEKQGHPPPNESSLLVRSSSLPVPPAPGLSFQLSRDIFNCPFSSQTHGEPSLAKGEKMPSPQESGSKEETPLGCGTLRNDTTSWLLSDCVLLTGAEDDRFSLPDQTKYQGCICEAQSPRQPSLCPGFLQVPQQPGGLQQDLRICELGFQPPLLQTAGLETQQLVTV